MFVSNYWHVCAKKLKEHFFPPFPQNAILLKRGLMSKLHQPYCFSEFKKNYKSHKFSFKNINKHSRHSHTPKIYNYKQKMKTKNFTNKIFILTTYVKAK